MSDLERLVTVAVAAELVGRSERRIRQLCSTGRISARKMGRAWLVDRVNLLEFFHRQERAAKIKAEVDEAIRRYS